MMHPTRFENGKVNGIYGTSTRRAHARMIDCWVSQRQNDFVFFSSNSIAHFAFSGKPPMHVFYRSG
jgi:hypothetical protein